MSNNNFDDFDDAPPSLDNGMEEEYQAPQAPRRASISETLKTNPAFKIFLILIAGGALASAALGVFSSKENRDNQSIIGQPGEVTSIPGGQASPAFQQAVVEASKQRATGAVQAGGSALPTPLGGETQITTLEPTDASASTDPLSEYRAQAVEPEQPAQEKPQQQPNNNAQPFGNAYAQQQAPAYDQNAVQNMQQQMQTLISAWQPSAAKVMKVTDEKAVDAQQQQQQQQQEQPNQGQGKMLVPAGTVNYGQMLIEANSDVQGPVMASIASGPFAGGKAIGAFQVADDYLVVHFSLISFQGKDYQTDVLALDPDTTLGGMATEVDHRYWSRIVFPAAAGFLSGFANAFAQADQNVTVQDGVIISSRAGSSVRRGLGEGLSRSGDRIGQILEQQGDRTMPLVKIAAGTPIGLFFVSSVFENQTGGQGGQNGQNGQYSQYGQNGGYGISTPYGQIGGQSGFGVPISQFGSQYGSQYGTQNGYNSQNNGYSGYNMGSNTNGSSYNNRSGTTQYPSGVSIIQNGGGTSRQPVYIGQ